MSIRRAKWVDSGGHEGHREWAHSKMDAVVAIPRTDGGGRWVFTREWRPSLDAWCVQFPGGMVDEGEDPMDAVTPDDLCGSSPTPVLAATMCAAG